MDPEAGKLLPRETIGVFGGASSFTEKQAIAGYQVGVEIARLGKCLVTGATTGVPLAAAIGAKSQGGLVVGISPAESPEEHLGRFRRPFSHHDMVVYSGAGVEGRLALIVRSARGGIFIGGEFGTLAEFSMAWTAGNNVLGVLSSSEGMAPEIQRLTTMTRSHYGSILLFGSDPVRLVRDVCAEVDARYSTARLSDACEDRSREVSALLRRAGVID